MRRDEARRIVGNLVRHLRGKTLKIYIAKPDTWFDAGTTVTLIADCQGIGGIFEGLRHGQLDEEFCPWDEFDVQDV